MASWPSGGYLVNNNRWSDDAGPQTIWADNYRHWGVSSKQASTTDVKVYPDVELPYYNTWATIPSLRNLVYLSQRVPAVYAARKGQVHCRSGV